jgi:hypothetical protein
MKAWASEMRMEEELTAVRPHPTAPIEVQLMGDGFLEVVHAIDISTKCVGIFLEHGIDDQQFGSRAEVILVLPRCQAVHLRVRICHQNGSSDQRHVSLEFLRLPPPAQSLLESYVARRQLQK